MDCEAVIFDLYGTLIYNSTGWAVEMNRSVAATLGAPVEEFVREWANTRPKRYSGAYLSAGDNIAQVCRTLGVVVTPERIEQAIALRLDYTRRNFEPKTGAIELLNCLRARHLKIGLLSNCTPEIPIVWPESSLCLLFDATVFSCVVGMAKPQPEIFELACRELGTEPQHCVYVADGEDGELEAALTCSLYPVRLRVTDGEIAPRDADKWQGASVDSLLELFPRLDPA